MIIGNFAADSYYGVKSYATIPAGTPAGKAVECMKNCPWWNPFCQNACVAAEVGYQAQVKGGPAVVDAVNKGLQNIGQQLGAGIGANAGTITPALTVLGIAAVGIIAIIMVIR
jgi:hypothetical protein